MTPHELEILKQQTLVHVANTYPSDPETLADALQVPIELAEELVRALVAEGRLKLVKNG